MSLFWDSKHKWINILKYMAATSLPVTGGTFGKCMLQRSTFVANDIKSASRINGQYRMYDWKANVRMILYACIG